MRPQAADPTNALELALSATQEAAKLAPAFPRAPCLGGLASALLGRHEAEAEAEAAMRALVGRRRVLAGRSAKPR